MGRENALIPEHELDYWSFWNRELGLPEGTITSSTDYVALINEVAHLCRWDQQLQEMKQNGLLCPEKMKLGY